METDFGHNKYCINGPQNFIRTWPNNNRLQSDTCVHYISQLLLDVWVVQMVLWFLCCPSIRLVKSFRNKSSPMLFSASLSTSSSVCSAISFSGLSLFEFAAVLLPPFSRESSDSSPSSLLSSPYASSSSPVMNSSLFLHRTISKPLNKNRLCLMCH